MTRRRAANLEMRAVLFWRRRTKPSAADDHAIVQRHPVTDDDALADGGWEWMTQSSPTSAPGTDATSDR